MSQATRSVEGESQALRWASWAGVACVVALSGVAFASAGPGDALGLFIGCAFVTAASLAWAGHALRRVPLATPEPSSRDPRSRLLLAALLLLAAILRWVGLDGPLWYDEVVTLVEFVRLPVPDLLTKYTTTNNHLLYSLSANRTVALLGETPVAVRLPAFVFGVASIGALWRFGLQVATRRETVLACALLALSYHHVWFSQNARGYTGILFFTLLSTSVFVQGMRERGRTLWLGYAALVALGLYTHLSIVFVYVSHGLVYLWLFARSRWRGASARMQGASEWWPLVGFALGGVLTLQLYAILLPQVFGTFAAQQAGSGGQRVGDWTNPLWTLLEIASALGLGPASIALAVPLALVGIAGFVSLTRRDPWIGALIVLPIALTLFALLALSFHVWPRYFLSSIGFVMLIGVRSVFVVTEWVAARSRPQVGRALAWAAFAVLFLGSALLLARNYALPKQDYPGARAWLAERGVADEDVLVVSLAVYPYTNYYAPSWRGAESFEAFESLRRERRPRFVVSSFPTYLANVHPRIAEALARDFEAAIVFRGTLGDGDVTVFRERER